MRQQGLDFGPEPRHGARASPGNPRVLSVGELTDRLKGLVETEFVDVWVEGEVSNLVRAKSGHTYFTLKDARAQIRAVLWKTQARLIRFRPQNGEMLRARGAVRVYEVRGEYQLQVEVLEPVGTGALQRAFEQLKQRLGAEGLFAQERKRPLPLLPRRVGLVTSPTGAVLSDFLRVLRRRFPALDVLVYPARVQGEGAAAEIAQGIRVLDGLRCCDVIVVARGGGSLEDLWAFNEETVARALVGSQTPTVSAVGHETDYTIADFSADLRAPTPSAAAELVVPERSDLERRLRALREAAEAGLRLRLARTRSRVEALAVHRVFEAERGRLQAQRQHVRELLRRGATALARGGERAATRTQHLDARLAAFRWENQLAVRRERAAVAARRLREALVRRLDRSRARLTAQAGRLENLSPLGVLARGYALVFDESESRLVRRPDDVTIGARIRVRVHGGRLGATVTDKEAS